MKEMRERKKHIGCGNNNIQVSERLLLLTSNQHKRKSSTMLLMLYNFIEAVK